MTNCQNKHNLSLDVLVTQAALQVTTFVVLLGSIMAPSLAQQNAPVNLLTVAPINEKANSSGSPNNIDEAVEQALEVDGLTTGLKNKKQTEETAKGRQTVDLTTNATGADSLSASPSADTFSDTPMGWTGENKENNSGDNTTSTADNGLVTQDVEADSTANVDQTASDKSTDAIYGNAKIGRRKISDVGLAAIGVGNLGKGQLDNLIWRGTSARDAVFLLQRGAVGGQSQAITRLAYEVVARQSVPPSGANNVAADLVEARLAFLAGGGRSSDLASLVSQLPDVEKWASWRRWLTEHYLMVRDDRAACDIVGREITRTLEPFWHKSNVICQAVKGNLGGARFAADILAANGIDDPFFFDLVDEVLNNKPGTEVDGESLNSAHIVLMDVANREIPLEGLSVLPNQMAETVMKLKFLGPDARMVSTFDGLKRGLISHRQAGKLWRNAGSSNGNPQIVIAGLDDNADALTTALAWRTIDADKRPERLSMVPKAVTTEIVAGNGAIMVPLYAELVRNALADDAVASTMRFDDLDVAPKLAFMLAINQPNDTTTLNAFGGNGDALQVAELLNGVDRGVIDLGLLSSLKIWHLMPVLDASGVSTNQIDWLDLVSREQGSEQSFISLSPVLLRAVASAAKNRHVAETVLLANWLLHDVPLHRASPSDLASVIEALDQIGQSETAKELAQEVVKAHLMQLLAEKMPDGTQS
jgi:hypothetical protein